MRKSKSASSPQANMAKLLKDLTGTLSSLTGDQLIQSLNILTLEETKSSLRTIFTISGAMVSQNSALLRSNPQATARVTLQKNFATVETGNMISTLSIKDQPDLPSEKNS